MVVETCSLGEGFTTQLTLVRLVTRVHPAVGLQGGVVPESLATRVTDVGTGVRVCPHVGDHGEFVSEGVATLPALPRPATRVLQQVVVQVGLGFESFITVRTLELADVFVDRINVRL